MEIEPDNSNVVYIDEFPELQKKVWLRRLNEQRRRIGETVLCQIFVLPKPPDGAA